ncbi:MAG: SAM-dependent methyltransferase, partial [Candidatus Omnitrophota bacterium]
IDVIQKGKGIYYSEDEKGDRTLLLLAREAINKLISDTPRIDRESLKKISKIYATIESNFMLARFKGKITMGDIVTMANKINDYAANNPRFKWTDHEGRNICKLIDIYLRTIGNRREIYQNIWDALKAEIHGRFKEWKYESEDYKSTLDEIAKIESEGLQGKEEEIKFKVQKVVERIKRWEETIRHTVVEGDEEFTAEFTDDFYTLFNIGNSEKFSACQDCTYGSDLNRGLVGYLVNGTNKAVVLLDKNRRVITRRIVRLRILEDDEGNEQPVIFVEESTQFNTQGIDKLYGILDILSQKTGLPVVVAPYRPASSDNVQKGKKKRFMKMGLFRGRSTYDYSDWYGGSLHITENRSIVWDTARELIVRPRKDVPEDQIEQEIRRIEGLFGLKNATQSSSPLSDEGREHDLGAQVSNLQKLNRFLKILRLLKNNNELLQDASDRNIVEWVIEYLDKEGLIEETAYSRGERIIKIKHEAKETRIGKAIERWAINPEGGIKAINFLGTDGVWTVLGFASELNDPDTLEHERKEIAFRKQGYTWQQAHERVEKGQNPYGEIKSRSERRIPDVERIALPREADAQIGADITPAVSAGTGQEETELSADEVVVDELKKAIGERGGKITFRDFMRSCLGHGKDAGYYTSGVVKIGDGKKERGHFVTYTEKVSPYFGKAITVQLFEMWTNMGSPDDFRVVEMGAGNGTLARDI